MENIYLIKFESMLIILWSFNDLINVLHCFDVNFNLKFLLFRENTVGFGMNQLRLAVKQCVHIGNKENVPMHIAI